MTDYAKMIQALVAQNVDFIIIGGAAAFAHGSSRLTADLDIVYSRGKSNQQRLVHALEQHKPRLRGAPVDLPFQWDEETLRNGLNFTLMTSVGPIDIFGEIMGGPSYEDLVADTVILKLFGNKCRCLNLERLIKVKEAMGRPKDLEVVKELKSLLQKRNSK